MFKNILLILSLSTYLLATAYEGNADKGLTYYKYIIRPMIDIHGSVFTKKHTSSEWKEYFLNNAEAFKKEFSALSPDFDLFINSSKFERIKPHLEAFLVNYSKDSGQFAPCGNDELD